MGRIEISVARGQVMLAVAKDKNETSALTYYLECAGENPMAKEVDDMAAAVKNLTDATASLTNLPTCDANLNTALQLCSHDINGDPVVVPPGATSACTTSHTAGCVIGDPVCANVPAAAVFTYIGIWLVPFATA